MSTSSTRRVVINILQSSGGGTPPPPLFEPDELDLYLPNAYEETEFFVVFEFLIEETTTSQNEDGNVEVRIYPATNVDTTFDFSQYNITYTKINDNTIRLDGPVRDAFPDQYYQFVLPDMSEPILPFDTDEVYYSLIKYQEPSNKLVRLEYGFSVDTFSPTVYHWIYWSFESAKQNIEYTIERGIA